MPAEERSGRGPSKPSPQPGSGGSASESPVGVSPSTGIDSPFGASLAPALRAACGGCLSEVAWFRTDWQRGGALTGYATYQHEGQDQEVVVKLPIGPGELQWLVRLGGEQGVAPRVYAQGEALGGYDMAWVVMERLAHGPLGAAWGGKEFDLLIEAAGRFYAATGRFPVGSPPAPRDWAEVLDLARASVRRHHLANSQRWNKALKQAQQKLRDWLTVWEARAVDQWCHGDFHLANAMTRVPPPRGPAVLLDFAMTRPGHWVEDAVYLEHLYWARRDRLGGRKLCKQIAQQRKNQGLSTAEDWPRLAEVYRALLAMGTPVVLRRDGDPQHVQAALEVLEAAV